MKKIPCICCGVPVETDHEHYDDEDGAGPYCDICIDQYAEACDELDRQEGRSEEPIWDQSHTLALRVARAVQDAAQMAINTVDEPHEGAYKAVRDLDVDVIALRIADSLN